MSENKTNKPVDELVEKINEIAEQNLRQDGYLNAMAFILRDGHFAPMELKFETDDEKHRAYVSIGLTAQKLGADRVILLNDVAARAADTPEEAKYMAENYDHECPLSYPESMRWDGILTLDIDLKSEKVDGFFRQYKRDGDEYSFEELVDNGSFSGGLVNNILTGFKYDMDK